MVQLPRPGPAHAPAGGLQEALSRGPDHQSGVPEEVRKRAVRTEPDDREGGCLATGEAPAKFGYLELAVGRHRRDRAEVRDDLIVHTVFLRPPDIGVAKRVVVGRSTFTLPCGASNSTVGSAASTLSSSKESALAAASA